MYRRSEGEVSFGGVISPQAFGSSCKMEAEITGRREKFVESNEDLHPRIKNKTITSTLKMTNPAIM